MTQDLSDDQKNWNLGSSVTGYLEERERKI